MSHLSALLLFIFLVLPLFECVLFGLLAHLFGWGLNTK
jgi:hypothetical protein